jgi:serine/threonine protein kinase
LCNNLPNQDLINKYGWCWKCQQPNTSKDWCQPCNEKEWVGLEGQELIEKFIQQKPGYGVEWIPYNRFTNIEQIGEGGFSKIYKAKWKEDRWDSKDVVIKSLTNSQNITPEFLTEIANTRLVREHSVDSLFGVVQCYGISQDPQTKNYVMVMRYMKDGNLRQYLQNNNNKLNLENKLERLKDIALALLKIHHQNLIHRDFHSGNILNGGEYGSGYISDLGLSCPANHQKQEGKIFGVLPYVAPEVLRGQPYTKASDIYSFGIIAYELLANSYPYPEIDNLALQVCLGHRPNMDKVPIPQHLKDLIKSCWDAYPEKRPSAEKLNNITGIWQEKKELTYWNEEEKLSYQQFRQQLQTLEKEYNTFSQNTPYQIYPNATTHSKLINTKQITEKLKTMEYSSSLQMDFLNLKLEDNQSEQKETVAQVEQPPK